MRRWRSRSATCGRSIALQPRPRPELPELAVRLQLPDYLSYKAEQRLEVHGGSVSILKGADGGL